MRAIAISNLAVAGLSLLLASEGAAQRPPLQCTESGSTIATSLAPGEPTISLSPDVRSLAGVSPALVLNIAVPAGPESVIGDILVLAISSGTKVRLPLHRAEYWNMGSLPRAPVATNGIAPLVAVDPAGETLYKLYFQVPKELPPEFEVVVEPLRYKNAELRIRPTLFRRGQSTEKVLLCPWGVR